MTGQLPTPDTINKLRTGADQSFAMLAGMQLDVFTPLKDRPMSLEELAKTLEVRPLKLRPLLYAIVLAGLLEVEDERFSNTQEAERFLVRGSPDYLGGMHTRLASGWEVTLKTAESIRTGTPQAKLDLSNASEDDLESFLRMLQGGAESSGHELARLVDLSSVVTFADIGGSSGGLAMAITRQCPQITATVIELPGVAPITQRIIDRAGLNGRVEVAVADVLQGLTAGPYDVVALRALIQVLSPDDAVRALTNIRPTVKPGGAILVIGHIVENSRLSPAVAVGFSLMTLNIYDEGQAYTRQEYLDWLTEAGFEDGNITSMSGGLTLVSAKNPA